VAARSRFVLTGTPIENSVEDLRALFDFCLPGYLKRAPSDLRGDDRQWFERQAVEKAAPYILRRSKAEVAPELPDKIEQTHWCELESRQREMYQAVREKTEQVLLQMASAGASENRLRFTILTELLRLRQVCADPGLLDPEYPLESSGKFQAFRELLSEAMDGSHRILVFSQFVKLLKRLRAWFDTEGIPTEYIDGSTRDRLAVCDRFNNNPEITVCLISLKAGGTGLNLTGADTVVHFDPWWNPAVEDQATDRAHRIGQSRTVTSYKLVTEGTVEDKVLALQLKKAGLLQDLLDESAIHSAKVDLSTLKSLLS
jgi:SNF2 family DNA or RNA helicase